MLLPHADLLTLVLSYCGHTDTRFVCRRFYELHKRKLLLRRSRGHFFFCDHLIDVDWGSAAPVCTAVTSPTRRCFAESVGGVRDARGLFTSQCEQQDDQFVVWLSDSYKLHLCPLWPIMTVTSVVDIRPMLGKKPIVAANLRIRTSASTVVLFTAMRGFVACFAVKEGRELVLQAATTLKSGALANLCIVEGVGVAVTAAVSGELSLFAFHNLVAMEPSPLPATGLALAGEGRVVVCVSEGVAHSLRCIKPGRAEPLWTAEAQQVLNTRFPGARSSGLRHGIIRDKAVSVASMAVLRLTDGEEILPPVKLGDNLSPSDVFSFMSDEQTDEFVGRMLCRKALRDGALECTFDGVDGSFNLSIPATAPNAVQAVYPLVLGAPMASKQTSCNRFDFAVSGGVMYYGLSHAADTGQCQVVAMSMNTQTILWATSLPAPCLCETHRFTIYVGRFRLCCIIYPRDGGCYPTVAFLWLDGGALCSPPTVLQSAKTATKCVIS